MSVLGSGALVVALLVGLSGCATSASSTPATVVNPRPTDAAPSPRPLSDCEHDARADGLVPGTDGFSTTVQACTDGKDGYTEYLDQVGADYGNGQ